jgi:Na+-transporting methylmalonyl-CoA/oxaloacetate decarboxylase gamma subunit
MNNLVLGFENIVYANGVTIALMGMLIVFAALLNISLFIVLLPRVLPLLEKIVPEKHHQHAPTSSTPADHEQVLAAIGYALFRKNAESLPAK